MSASPSTTIACPPPKAKLSSSRTTSYPSCSSSAAASQRPGSRWREPPADAEARPVERRLGVEPVVDESRHELEVRLSLDQAAHHAERADELPGTQEHPGDDRVIGPPARDDAALELEAGPAVLQDHSRTGRDKPRSEPAEEALDERHGHSLAVDGTEVHRPTRRLRDCDHPGGAAPHDVPGVEQVADIGAVADPLAGIGQRELDAPHLAGEVRREPSEERQRLERSHTLGRRRQLGDIEPPVVRGERRDPAGLEACEILLLEPAPGTDRLCDRAAVERVGTFGRNPPQGGRELRQAHTLTASRRRQILVRDAGRRPQRCRFGGRCPRGGRDRGHREPVLGGVDRRCEAGLETEPPMALGERCPARDGSRHRHRAGPERLDRAMRVGRPRRGAGRVEALEPAVAPDEREGVSADARGHRLDHREDGRGRDGGIGGVAAGLEHAEPGLRGTRLRRRDHGLAGDGRRPPGSKAIGHLSAASAPVGLRSGHRRLAPIIPERKRTREDGRSAGRELASVRPRCTQTALMSSSWAAARSA